MARNDNYIKMPRKLKKGIILSLITAIISGLAIFYNQLIVVAGIDSTIFNIIKNGGVAIILSCLILSSNKGTKLTKLKTSQWVKLSVIALIGGSLPFILFFQGLKETAAINANLIHKTLFIWVAAMAIPFLSERLTFGQILGYILIVLANFFLGGFSGFVFNRGEMLIFLATLLWALENIIAKITLKTTDAVIVSWGRMFLGTLILLLLALFQNKLHLLTNLTLSQIVPTLGSIILLAGYVLTWYHALKYAPATIVTSVLILATPITNILTAIFITHTFAQINLLHTLALSLGVLTVAYFASSLKLKPKAEVT